MIFVFKERLGKENYSFTTCFRIFRGVVYWSKLIIWVIILLSFVCLFIFALGGQIFFSLEHFLSAQDFIRRVYGRYETDGGKVLCIDFWARTHEYYSWKVFLSPETLNHSIGMCSCHELAWWTLELPSATNMNASNKMFLPYLDRACPFTLHFCSIQHLLFETAAILMTSK